MPATLDPATALVLIDLQHGITGMPTAHPSEEIVARCAQLAEAFRANAKLVAATRVAFARDGGDVIKTRTAESPGRRHSGPGLRSAPHRAGPQRPRHPDHQARLERVLRHRARP
jgi:nicotinamidase-related amidase